MYQNSTVIYQCHHLYRYRLCLYIQLPTCLHLADMLPSVTASLWNLNTRLSQVFYYFFFLYLLIMASAGNVYFKMTDLIFSLWAGVTVMVKVYVADSPPQPALSFMYQFRLAENALSWHSPDLWTKLSTNTNWPSYYLLIAIFRKCLQKSFFMPHNEIGIVEK